MSAAMNQVPFEVFIAWRYLRARRKQAFISLISLISGIGVAVGVTALLIVLALMTGLQGELRDRLVGAQAHIFVHKSGGLGPIADEVKALRTVPHVTGAAPTVLGYGLIRSADREDYLSIKGIDPTLERDVTNVGSAMIKGSLDAVVHTPGEIPGIVLGKELSEKLGVTIDDTVEVMTPEGPLTPFGTAPQLRGFKVVGIFSLGLYEYDSAFGYVDLSVAQRMLDKARPDYIELRLDDMFRADAVASGIPDLLGPSYVAEGWAQTNRSLFQALWLEKIAMSITIGLIVMVAALNIIASLILLVMEKTRDIAILKTMGTSSASIRRIFILQGLIIGLLGTMSGALLGSLLIFVLDRFKLITIPLDVYQISHVPFRLEPLDFVVVVVVAVLICFVATIYPSRQASKLDPAQALRYQ
jgi:lipoprotein-releasing system permease protein